MVEDLVVLRYVNVFYYICFLSYMLIFLFFIIPRRKEQPYKNAFTIFLATSLVLIAMEFFGTFTGIRVFYIDSQIHIGFQLICQIIMGVGEGGTATAIIYLMIESLYVKNTKKYIIYLSSLAILMLIFAAFTFTYNLTQI